MRRLMMTLAGLVLWGCSAAETPQPPQAAADTAFNMPMDPSMISCRSLSNPNARAASQNWAIGQARAAVLSGQIQDVPNEETLQSQISMFCVNAPQSTIGDAWRQIVF